MTTTLEEPGTELATTSPQQEALLFSVTPKTIKDMTVKCLAMTINGVGDTEGREAVRKQLRECVTARTTIDKEHKAAKEPAWTECQRLDALKREMVALIAVPEKHLEAQIDAVNAELAKIEKAKADAAYAIRLQQLTNAGGSLPESVIRAMNEHEFAEEVARMSERTRLKKEADDRQAAEIERLRLESEQLAKDRAEFAKQQAEQRAELDRQRQEQQAEADRLKALEATIAPVEVIAAQAVISEPVVTTSEPANEPQSFRGNGGGYQSYSSPVFSIPEPMRGGRPLAKDTDEEKLLALAVQLEAIAMPTVGAQSESLLKKVEAIINQAAFDIRTAVKPPKKARVVK